MEHQFSIIKAFENFAELGAEWVMWLMVVLGFVLIVLTIERLVLFLRTRVDAPQIARELITLLNQGKVEEAKATLARLGMVFTAASPLRDSSLPSAPTFISSIWVLTTSPPVLTMAPCWSTWDSLLSSLLK